MRRHSRHRLITYASECLGHDGDPNGSYRVLSRTFNASAELNNIGGQRGLVWFSRTTCRSRLRRKLLASPWWEHKRSPLLGRVPRLRDVVRRFRLQSNLDNPEGQPSPFDKRRAGSNGTRFCQGNFHADSSVSGPFRADFPPDKVFSVGRDLARAEA
jgi:hypothetical protein